MKEAFTHTGYFPHGRVLEHRENEVFFRWPTFCGLCLFPLCQLCLWGNQEPESPKIPSKSLPLQYSSPASKCSHHGKI